MSPERNLRGETAKPLLDARANPPPNFGVVFEIKQ